MIKFIVSDIDGTLLEKGEEVISESRLNIIENLKNNKIAFAVASGRSYRELLYIMREMKDIYYICCDGGCIIKDDSLIYEKAIDNNFSDEFKNNKNIYFHTPFENKINISEEDRVIKISAFGGGYFEAPCGTYEVYKDKEWREWIKNGCGKGQAVEYIQNINKININETAVFGDNFNDMGMFRRAYLRYCMSKAPGQVKMLCNCITDDIEKAFKEAGGI